MIKSASKVFDKSLRVKRLNLSSVNMDAHVYDYLRDHVSKDLCDRIDDIKSDGKRSIMSIGSCSGLIAKNINSQRVESFIQTDISRGCLDRCKRLNSMLPPNFPTEYIECDQESLPLRENWADAVISCLDLHWVNDLPGCFKQVNKILKKESIFIGCLFGGDTLQELRSALQLAELERLSGFSNHVAPKTTGQDIVSILQSTGFQLITVDVTDIIIRYPSMFELMFDLQGMGENNSSLLASRHMHRDVLKASASIYQSLYGDSDLDKGVPATFQIIHFIGWKNPAKATKLKTIQ